PHDGSAIAWERRPRFFIDTRKFTGKAMMAYGQTAITEDLYAARDAAGGGIIDETANVALHELTSARPYATYGKDGQKARIDCDYIAGCDGYHGVSRPSIPASVLRTYEKGYPFGWLGIMSQTPPFPDLCYCYHSRGFALASMRSPMLSRYYIQCELDARLEDWPDERFWQEFKARCPPDMAEQIVTAHRSKNRLRRCAVLSRSRCVMAVSSWPGTRDTSIRPRVRKASILPCRMCSTARAPVSGGTGPAARVTSIASPIWRCGGSGGPHACPGG